MDDTFAARLEEARTALSEESPQDAFGHLRPVLSYPGAPELAVPSRWAETWELFARIAGALSATTLEDAARQAVKQPTDAEGLYALGFALVDQGLNDVAATVLSRGHREAPDSVEMLQEWVAALEGMGASAEAVRVLHAAPALVTANPFLMYLLAFNALMTGDLLEPRTWVAQLEARMAAPLDDAEEPPLPLSELVERLKGGLARADAIRAVTPLDTRDLRGWHAVITGGLLLHLSPYGRDEGMNGRYAFVQDSEQNCLEGIHRVAAVLARIERAVPCVFILPERDSAILGLATAQVLGLRAVPWPEEGTDAPGLVVAYDVSHLEGSLREQLHRHHPGQVLWSHACPWTESPPFAPDLVTLLYQMNVSPWAQRLVLSPDGQQPERAPAEEGSEESLAARLASRTLSDEALADLSVLGELASALAMQEGPGVAGLFREHGRRRRQFTDSPVKSNRFA
ncbi:hypothetical protein KRR26_28795 [Corallococcus sp. M34]|uniref:tetratricopeptide repeat protein n=1 Tax=Citreicoccus inhibens TaxID=2849499 RepID=UPI001C2257B5|nr:hypothetical protein [Citreicoccus inhibens]MBU8899615.1 hypothetical protein [Citreicoccus inhibens]